MERNMKHGVKKWLHVALVLTVLVSGAAAVNVVLLQIDAQANALPPADQWRNHDGHWSFYHAGDKRWYYTDGVHWYYHDGLAWVLYPFDKLFGRDFHRGDYKVPPAAEVKLPHHGIFR
jgi:hypothetical protein